MKNTSPMVLVFFILMIAGNATAFATDLTVTGTLSNGVYHADGKITSANTCEVESTKNVYFLASTSVGLNPGFRVQAGGKLNVIIGDQSDLPAGLDADNDQMPDVWEIQYGIDTTQDNSDEDADGDGATNLVECYSDTNPTDGNSRPKGTYFEYNSDGRIKKITRVD
ncbi:MAG: hypothetical protein C4522_21725 [Desulfobacteraceae bacterium]|nr:MAG: hypothetical protein C4522_21725 [Desulfobacteraceae bacterium]